MIIFQNFFEFDLSMKIIENMSIEKLYASQRSILFLVILLFPIQTILFYQKSLLSTFSFYGQISSVPLLVGFALAVVVCFQEKAVKRYLLPVSGIAIIYVLLCAGISLHSIVEYSTTGSFDVAIFGETPKIRLLKGWLVTLGITSDAVLYGSIVLMRDTLNSVREIVFAFGLVAWIAFLSRKDFLGTFKTVRKAVLWSMALLTPYVACEVLHLFGWGGATAVLKTINSSLYEPSSFLGWYPPLVSPNQVRGTWTEPAYFAIWLAFSVPFLVSYFFRGEALFLKKAVVPFVSFSALFSIWFMTYARTSVVLIAALVGLYFLFAILFRTRENWRVVGILVVTALIGFLITSTCGPQERGQWAHNQTEASAIVQGGTLAGSRRQWAHNQTEASATERLEKTISESVLLENTVKSSVDAESRSTPSRLQDFQLKFKVFKDYPITGAGDTLASVAQIRKMLESPDTLTQESRQRMAYTYTNGLFQSGVNGSSLSISGVLACRGLLGFTVLFVPILLLGLSLFICLFKVKETFRGIGITLFISCAGSFLAAFSQGLWYYYFWCSAGLALGFLLWARHSNSSDASE